MSKRRKTGAARAPSGSRRPAPRRPVGAVARKNKPAGSRPKTKARARKAESLARLKRELTEARERQFATSEVLKVISSSPGELKPVFESMLANAMRICESQCGFIYQMEAGAMRAMAEIGVPPPSPSIVGNMRIRAVQRRQSMKCA